MLDPIIVEGAFVSQEAIALERIEALPGGAALISARALEGKADIALSDALSTVPGVVVQDFFGGYDQPRLQIRGSGLQQSPSERGVLVLKDGLPLNRADGSYVVGLATPGHAAFTEVYRGYTGNRLGASVLGGAVNFTSPNGADEPGVALGVEGGSFGAVTTTARAAGSDGDLDGQVQATYSRRDGFRDHNESERLAADVNLGARLTDDISTRLFLGYTDLGFDVAGPLTWDALQDDPQQAYAGPTVALPGPVISNPGPNVARDKPRRDTRQLRVGSRSSIFHDAHLFDIGAGYAYTDDEFTFPIANGVRSTDGGDLTGVLRYSYSPDDGQPLPLVEATAQYVIGAADREYHHNVGGEKGAKFGDSKLDAATLSLHAGMNIPLGGGFVLAPGVSFTHATRDNDDQFGLGLRPVTGFNPVSGALTSGFALAQDTSYSRSYSGWSPSLGLSWQLAPGNMVFGAVSRSFEPPTHDDLLATANGTPFFGPGAPVGGAPQLAFSTPELDAQTATTVELGWRGAAGALSWEAVGYYSWLENEILSLRDASGAQIASMNADKTTHFGVELGLKASLTEGLDGRLAYTFQEFRFDGDASHGDNRLAGAPRHSVNAAIRYLLTPDLFVEAEVDWRPDETPVDNANTLFADPWATLDLRANYDLTDAVSLYGEARNVFDATYASSTLVVDTARSDQAAFIPGDGRAFYVGVKAEW